MANTPTALVRTSLGDTNATLYTVSGNAVITSIVLCNTSSSDARNVTLSLDGTKLFDNSAVAANTTVIAEIKQTMTNATLIEGSASAATDVKIHISGMVIS